MPEYAERSGHHWLVLAAERDLLTPPTCIEPYDIHVNEVDSADVVWVDLGVLPRRQAKCAGEGVDEKVT